MALGLIGKKIGMTQIFDEAGMVIPVTVLQLGPCPIIQVKRKATDGYTAIQIGYGDKPERLVNKPELGHFKKANLSPSRLVREIRIDEVDGYEVGKSIAVDIFEVGEKVDVIGVSKGKGFAGPTKRHHSKGGPESHGSMYHRRPGSMGASSDPSHVWKGKKAAGRMGGERVTTQNLRVVKVDADRNVVFLRGAVPGHVNGFVMVAKSKKAARRAARKKPAGK
jgi:large subunit ribosomal protein L3